MANIHPLATVHPNAKLGENVEVGPYAYIEEHVEIGDGKNIKKALLGLAGPFSCLVICLLFCVLIRSKLTLCQGKLLQE